MSPDEKLREIMVAKGFNPALDFSTPVVARAFGKWVLEEAAEIVDELEINTATAAAQAVRALAAKLDEK